MLNPYRCDVLRLTFPSRVTTRCASSKVLLSGYTFRHALVRVERTQHVTAINGFEPFIRVANLDDVFAIHDGALSPFRKACAVGGFRIRFEPANRTRARSFRARIVGSILFRDGRDVAWQGIVGRNQARNSRAFELLSAQGGLGDGIQATLPCWILEERAA